MNKVYALITSLLMIFGVGCEDTGNSDAKYKLLLSVVENGTTFSVKTYLGTVEADKKEKVIGYFNDAASVIQTAADSGQIEPEVFRKYVTEQIDKQVAAPYNAVIATTLDLALDGYNKFYAANVKDKIENEPKAKEIIGAIVAGIHSGADPVGGDVLDTSNPLEGEIDWNL
jgi:hypothetical protein